MKEIHYRNPELIFPDAKFARMSVAISNNSLHPRATFLLVDEVISRMKYVEEHDPKRILTRAACKKQAETERERNLERQLQIIDGIGTRDQQLREQQEESASVWQVEEEDPEVLEGFYGGGW